MKTRNTGMKAAGIADRRPKAGGESTRERILNAAEIEFARRGFEGCSLRMISDAYRINLGLIHYYFDSKENLFTEAYLRRTKGLVDRRKSLLAESRARSGPKPIPIADIVRSFLLPLVEMTRLGSGPEAWIRLQGLLRADPSDFSRNLRGKALNPSNKMFIGEIQRSCPHLSRASVVWRFSAMVGGFYSLISRSSRVDELSGGRCDPRDLDAAFAEALPFFVRGFEASAISESKPRKAAPERAGRGRRAENRRLRSP